MKKIVLIFLGALFLSGCKMSCAFEILPPKPDQKPIFLIPQMEQDGPPLPRFNKLPDTKA